MSKERFQIGTVRIVDGKVEIFAKKWLQYPVLANELITLAYAHGWAVDDGLPHLKIYENGYPFIRILLARPAGRQARSLDNAPAIQFHITWQSNNTGWQLGSIYAKFNQEMWQTYTMVEIRRTIVQYALRIPGIYVKASN